MTPEEELGYQLAADAIVCLRQLGTTHVTLTKKRRRRGNVSTFEAVSNMAIFVKDIGLFIPANKRIKIKKTLRLVEQEREFNGRHEWHTIGVKFG